MSIVDLWLHWRTLYSPEIPWLIITKLVIIACIFQPETSLHYIIIKRVANLLRHMLTLLLRQYMAYNKRTMVSV